MLARRSTGLALAAALAASAALATNMQPAATEPTARTFTPVPGPVSIDQLAFFAGDWSADRPNRTGGSDFTQEVWSAPAGNNMMGMFRWVAADGACRVFELLTITEEDGTLVLRLRHQDARGNAWEAQDEPATLHLTKLASSDPDSDAPSVVVFTDTAESCDLAACEYDASTPGQLVITVKFDDVARPDLVFTLSRTPTPAP